MGVNTNPNPNSDPTYSRTHDMYHLETPDTLASKPKYQPHWPLINLYKLISTPIPIPTLTPTPTPSVRVWVRVP